MRLSKYDWFGHLDVSLGVRPTRGLRTFGRVLKATCRRKLPTGLDRMHGMQRRATEACEYGTRNSSLKSSQYIKINKFRYFNTMHFTNALATSVPFLWRALLTCSRRALSLQYIAVLDRSMALTSQTPSAQTHPPNRSHLGKVLHFQEALSSTLSCFLWSQVLLLHTHFLETLSRAGPTSGCTATQILWIQ